MTFVVKIVDKLLTGYQISPTLRMNIKLTFCIFVKGLLIRHPLTFRKTKQNNYLVVKQRFAPMG